LLGGEEGVKPRRLPLQLVFSDQTLDHVEFRGRSNGQRPHVRAVEHRDRANALADRISVLLGPPTNLPPLQDGKALLVRLAEGVALPQLSHGLGAPPYVLGGVSI
jgi:hypothetical protein